MPEIHETNTKFLKEMHKFRGFLIAKSLDLVYNKECIIRTKIPKHGRELHHA